MPIGQKPLYKGKEFMTIKEFAAFSGVELTTLRYWDEIGLFSPAMRNDETNYRYYSPLQQSTVNFITLLSSLGIPLKSIGDIQNQRTPENILALLEHQENIMDMKLRNLRESYSIIHRLRSTISAGMKANPDEIAIKHMEDAHYILGPRNVWGTEPSFYETFMHFCKEAPHLRINLNYTIGGLYESVEAFMQAPAQPGHFFSIDPTGYEKRPAGDYLTGYVRGYHYEFGDLPQRMMAYAEKHGLELFGPVRAVCLHDEICMRRQDQYLARIIIAARPKPKTVKQSEWAIVSG